MQCLPIYCTVCHCQCHLLWHLQHHVQCRLPCVITVVYSCVSHSLKHEWTISPVMLTIDTASLDRIETTCDFSSISTYRGVRWWLWEGVLMRLCRSVPVRTWAHFLAEKCWPNSRALLISLWRHKQSSASDIPVAVSVECLRPLWQWCWFQDPHSPHLSCTPHFPSASAAQDQMWYNSSLPDCAVSWRIDGVLVTFCCYQWVWKHVWVRFKMVHPSCLSLSEW